MKNLWLFEEKRILILRELLGCREASGCDIKECLRVKKALLSHHLAFLRKKGIIEERKEGREKYYRIKPNKISLVKKVVTIVE